MPRSFSGILAQMRMLMGLPFLLKCLGRPHLVFPNGEPVRFRVRKHLALLTYLAVEPRTPQRREKLADMFWPNVSLSEGRHSLATAVSMIRGKLGRGAIEGGRDHLRFVAPAFAVDLERLASGDIMGDEFRPPLEVAGFLEDFELPDAHEFMLWQDRQRARWLPLVRDALLRLIDRRRRTGGFKQIEHLANSLLEIDELSEDGIRAKMEARAFDGDRLTALKIYEHWKQKLAEELQAAPSPLVEGIAIRLRRRDWEQAPTNIPTVPTDQWRGRPFIGRAAEYRTLYEAWEKTVQRLPHHALVVGDSGVGKSTLLERVVTAAGLEGAAISRVSCYELEREIPYAAMGSLVLGLLDRPGVSGTPPEWLAELSRTVPEVRTRFPNIPEPIDTHGETARLRLTEAVQQMMLSIAEEHPVILVIDDVHLADDASLAVLHLLIRRTADQRIMVLLAARAAELGQSPHAVKLREGHEPLRMSILELAPMTEKECEELLGSLLPSDTPQPSAAARRALVRAAAGYPMVLEYLVKDWQSNGEQCLALSIGAMTEEPRTAEGPSQTYRMIVQRIARNLDPSARNVLNMAAILGGRVNEITFYSLADVSLGQTMMGLGRLTDLRILRDGGRGLEFCNELVRGEAYLAIPSPVRKALHRSIADQLLAKEENGEGVPGLEIAWHSIRAGRTSEATPYLLRGAREAIRRAAPHEAERALVTAMGHLHEPARTDATLLLAEALKEQGKWRAALDALADCRCEESDERSGLATVLAAEPRRRLGLIPPDQVDSDVARLLALASSCRDINVRARAVTNAAHLLLERRDDSLAAQVSQTMSLLGSECLSDENMAYLAVGRALIHYHFQEYEQAYEELSGTAARLERNGACDLATASVHAALGNIATSAGEYAEALTHNLNAYKMALHIGNDSTCRRLAGNLAMCSTRLGHYKEAIYWGRAALAEGQPTMPDTTSRSLYNWAIGHAMLGQNNEASEVLDRLLYFARTIVDNRVRQNVLLFCADALQLMGNTREALELARSATSDSLSELQSFFSAGQYARWVAALGLAARNTESAFGIVNKLMHVRSRLDRVDRTEVLMASVLLRESQDSEYPELLHQLGAEITGLPKGAVDQFKRMRFFPSRLAPDT